MPHPPAAQKMQAVQHMAQTASVGADAAQTLANTNVGGGSDILSKMLGNPQGVA